MARIDLTRLITAYGIGAVDELLEKMDKDKGRTRATRAWATWYRLGAHAVSLLGYAMDIFPAPFAGYAETALIATGPLAVKSVARLIQEGFGAQRALVAPSAYQFQAPTSPTYSQPVFNGSVLDISSRG